MSINSIREVYFSLPLYSDCRFDLSNLETLELVKQLLFRSFKIDEFNMKLNDNTTYTNVSYLFSYEPNDLLAYEYNHYVNSSLKCVRSNQIYYFWFKIIKDRASTILTIIKIGQYPSIADLEIGKQKKYIGLLSQEYLSELNKAIGLVSHGVGIGAFVYIRRVFERLIENYHQEAQKNITDWDKNAFNAFRMADKIERLKDYLPEVIVEFRALYSILSKGIHELSEQECLKYFPIIKDAIIAILEQDYLKRENDKKQAAIRANILKIQQEMS